MMSTFTSSMSALTVEINEMRKQRSVDSQEISVLTVKINEMRKQRSVDSQEISVLTVKINEMRRHRSVDSQEIIAPISAARTLISWESTERCLLISLILTVSTLIS